MRSVAWNQIFAKHMALRFPMEPGPWDDDDEKVNGMFVKRPEVPTQLLPCLATSWTFSCGAGAVPPGPPPSPPPSDYRPSRWAASDEEPEVKLVKWQYQGGKKRKWADYDGESAAKLEWARQNAKISVVLYVDDWTYTVVSEMMEQFSWETEAVTFVQRLSTRDESRRSADLIKA